MTGALVLLMALSAVDSRAQFYACGAASKNYVVGMALPPSGLFEWAGTPQWAQLGFNHPTINAADYDPRDPGVLYLAGGNGCIRASGGGRQWKILTGWQMTEVQDVSLDRAEPGTIYIALSDGIGFSADAGATWTHRDVGIARKFVQSVQVDRSRAGRVLAGAEQGIFLSTNRGVAWRLAGARGKMITDLAQSTRDPRRWMATAQRGGLFASADGGATWKSIAPEFAAQTLYSVSLDPHEAQRVAVCGWEAGVRVSEDWGKTWIDRTEGLPSKLVWRVSFDPRQPRRLWASVHEEAVFVSDDLGVTWRRAGLEGTIIRDFVFAPQGGAR